jgi:acetoin utilization deacetylase AcuC-like enzyme
VPEPGPRTGIVLDDRCLTHVNPPGGLPFGALPEWATVDAFERPERLALTRRVLEGSGVLERVRALPAREADEDELRLAHTAAHVAAVLEAAGGAEPVPLGHEAWAGPGSRAPALLAVGGLLEAVRAVLDGELGNAFVLARPPGHHAEPEAAMGFCLFNATAIAARWAQRRYGLERVAILDWDVHHGNGSEAIFWEDGSVLTISLHQERLYPPDRGDLEHRGAGAGAGFNVNVPLPPGTGDAGYALAFERIAEPALRAFGPELLLVGAGADAAASDPLGRMSVTVPGFRAWTDWAVALAGEVCGGRLVAFLEGGYSLQHLPLANLALLEGLAGLPPSFETDPVGCDVPPGLREEERTAVEVAERVHALDRGLDSR